MANIMKKNAFSLVECMVTLVLLLITVGAIMSFRCYSITAAERAENQLMAAHTAYVLSEAWKSAKADPAFDPVSRSYPEGFVIESNAGAGPIDLTGFGAAYAGSWRVRAGDKEFGAHLYYDDYPAVNNMRLIHVVVTWVDTRQNTVQYHLPTLAATI